MPKQSKRNNKRASVSFRQKRRLLMVPFTALVIKIFIISKIQGFDWFSFASGDVYSGLTEMIDKNYIPPNTWYGADGDNYIRGLAGLVKDGFNSTEGKLSYWPAGYPLLLWPLLTMFKSHFFFAVAFLQSALYACACAFFVDELRMSRLVKYSMPVALFLTCNPTLTLNTIAIGYESPSVSLSLISVASLMRYFRKEKKKVVSMETLIATFSFTLASLMQPRLILMALATLILWSLAKFRVSTSIVFLLSTLAVVAIAPATLALRNFNANGYAAVSTNLGTTMNIGAGPNSTGGYTNKATGVDCPKVDGNPSVQDSALVKCVLQWYVKNPTSAIKLAWNKSLYFWSPWFGPVANGTMARNPWRINHPFAETIKTESGFKLVYGTWGKVVSWAWMLLTIAMLFYGFLILWKAGGLEHLLSLVALSTVLLNWLSSVGTIGDHRFRIPSMGMSLFLQAVAFTSLFLKKKRRFSGSSIPVEWPGLRWKTLGQPDNLPS